MIAFKNNRIQVVPEATLPKATLRWLILTDNAIGSLPTDLGDCCHLQKLMLAGNALTELPGSIDGCTALELVRISANRFDAMPHALLSLPRLSWLAFSGNPFSDQQAALRFATREHIRHIDWSQLALHEKLGEGASGVIHRGRWTIPDGGEKDVAVKLFKGAVTSDGWPHNEMEGSICAEAHPNLIPVLGKVVHHPDEIDALVFSLIPPSFVNLSGPPSMASCTRDVYAPELAFDPSTALRIVHGTASAACHLHALGVAHGDLYGHNLLVTAQGDCLLGDFGAASLYDRRNEELAGTLERIEVRAFGCLLEEVLDRVYATEGFDGDMARLRDLQARCLADSAGMRPRFVEVLEVLGSVRT
ncbi:hypothetical protein HKX48_001422 [Thoreauomyces humboldtii]|nr:hypothetical protein HKX48_001422 [Thoreauomyces humboldtii]